MGIWTSPNPCREGRAHKGYKEFCEMIEKLLMPVFAAAANGGLSERQHCDLRYGYMRLQYFERTVLLEHCTCHRRQQKIHGYLQRIAQIDPTLKVSGKNLAFWLEYEFVDVIMRRHDRPSYEAREQLRWCKVADALSFAPRSPNQSGLDALFGLTAPQVKPQALQ